MKFAFKLLVFVFSFSFCTFTIFASDDLILEDPSGSGVDIIESAEQQEQDPDQDSDFGSDIFSDGSSIDTLVVNELIIEGEEEAVEAAAQAEIYSIAPGVQYGAYFHANITDFGDSYIYIPVNYASDSFSYNSDGIPINITGSTITGYVAGSNSNQSIQFPSFGLPRYRVSNNYDYIYLTDWEEIDSTVTVYSSDDNFYSYSEVYFLRFVVLLLAADLFVNFLIRLLGGLRS